MKKKKSGHVVPGEVFKLRMNDAFYLFDASSPSGVKCQFVCKGDIFISLTSEEDLENYWTGVLGIVNGQPGLISRNAIKKGSFLTPEKE